jgi:hypothetical protein
VSFAANQRRSVRGCNLGNENPNEEEDTETTNMKKANYSDLSDGIKTRKWRSELETEQHKLQQKNLIYSWNPIEFTQPRRSPPSLPHLIGNYTLFLAHFYSRIVKMNLGSGKELHPL